MMTNKPTDGLPSLKTSPLNASSFQLASVRDHKLNHFSALIQRLWGIRILRFLVVGAINTLFSYLVYAFLVLIGSHYTIATLISTVLGVIFNFFITGRIVFRNMDRNRFIRFVLVYSFTYFVNILLLRGLVDGMKMDKLIAGALVTLPIALLSYFLNSKWTFQTLDNKQKNTSNGVSNGGAG